MESKKPKDQATLRENVEHKMPEGSWQEIRLEVERRVRWWSDNLCHAKLLHYYDEINSFKRRNRVVRFAF